MTTKTLTRDRAAAPEIDLAAEMAEIGRRAREVEDGSAVLEEWSAVRERLAARRRARRAP
jgi:hypothetical protein